MWQLGGGLQHHLEGRSVADLIEEDFDWQLGWEYQLTDNTLI